MGQVSLDAEIQGFLTTGLDYIRANIGVCDAIFETWLLPHMQRLYGQEAINQVKQWLKDNEVPVVLSWGLQNAKFPCLSVHLAQEQERVEAATLSDHADLVDNFIDQPVIVPSFVPKKFSQSSGKVTPPASVVISNVFPGSVLVDHKREEYLIKSPIDDTSFTIDLIGKPVDARSMFVKAGPGQINEPLRGASSRSLAHVDIGIHAAVDYQVGLWLYYLVQFIFFRFKLDMETRGIQLHTFAGSEFNKDSKFLPENVFSRWYRYSAQVSIEWTEPWATRPGGFTLTTRDPGGVTLSSTTTK